MSITEKIKRNKKLLAMHKKGLSYRKLGTLFKINYKTAYDIVVREKNRSLGAFGQNRYPIASVRYPTCY